MSCLTEEVKFILQSTMSFTHQSQLDLCQETRMSDNKTVSHRTYITRTLLFSNVGIFGREKSGIGERGLRSGRICAVETLSGMGMGRRLP
jgi:hypothetical protein